MSSDNDDEETFVDARLYITIRPPLEYRIIEVGRQAVSRLVGDDQAQQEYTGFEDAAAPRGTSPSSFALLDDTRLDHLCSLCMSVCSMTDEYLRAMEVEWMEFLGRVHSGLCSERRR